MTKPNTTDTSDYVFSADTFRQPQKPAGSGEFAQIIRDPAVQQLISVGCRFLNAKFDELEAQKRAQQAAAQKQAAQKPQDIKPLFGAGSGVDG